MLPKGRGSGTMSSQRVPGAPGPQGGVEEDRYRPREPRRPLRGALAPLLWDSRLRGGRGQPASVTVAVGNGCDLLLFCCFLDEMLPGEG